MTKLLQNARDGQLLLLLILPEKDHSATRTFLDQHITNPAKLHSLYLIFSNGEQFQGRWVNTSPMPQPGWCRSCTNELLQDIRDFCRAVCIVLMQFYHQHMMRAQDAFDQGQENISRSIVRLYATQWQQFSRFVAEFS